MEFFKFLYYRYYNSQVRLGNADVAPFSAMLIIAFTMMLYLFDLFTLISVLFPHTAPNLSWKFSFAILGSIILFLYIVLIFKGKYRQVIKEQENQFKNKRSLVAILFPLIAFALFITVFVVKILQNQGRI